jgi:hypothetical protein
MGNGLTLPTSASGAAAPGATNVGGYGENWAPLQIADVSGGMSPTTGAPLPDTSTGGGDGTDGLTLGGVANAGNLLAPPQPYDVAQHFQTYGNIINQAYQPAMRQHLDPSTKPPLWFNLLTFGMAGAAHHDYEAAYNERVDRDNATLRQAAARDTLGMVGEDLKAHYSGLNNQMRILQLIQRQSQLSYENLVKGMNLEAKGLIKQPNSEELARWHLLGFDWQPSDHFPGLGTKVRTGQNRPSGPSGGDIHVPVPGAPGAPPASRPIPPNSPMGQLGIGQGSSGRAPAGGTPDPAGAAPSDAGGPARAPAEARGYPSAAFTDQGTTTTTLPPDVQILEEQKRRQAGDLATIRQSAKDREEVRQAVSKITTYLTDPGDPKAGVPSYDDAIRMLPEGGSNALVATAQSYLNPLRFEVQRHDPQLAPSAYKLQDAIKQVLSDIRSNAGSGAGARLSMPLINLFEQRYGEMSRGGMTRPMAAAAKADILHAAQQLWGAVQLPGEQLNSPIGQAAPRVSPTGRAYTIGP